MEITIIYDNTTYEKNLKSDWGFSCLVESEDTPKLLFDTGGNGKILLSNMSKLGINPKSIDEVFISHAHYDHTGGLSDFLKRNSDVRVYFPAGLSNPQVGGETVSIDRAQKIRENVFSTGKLSDIEQSPALKTEKGLVVIVGCSHPGVKHILKEASHFGNPYVLIGGLHGFSKFDLIGDLDLICPVHCTQHKSETKSRYPEKFIEGGAGKIMET